MNHFQSIRTPQLDTYNREALRNYFQNTWELQDLLMKSSIGQDTFYLSPDPLRNRLIFYLGHAAVFYINKLIQVGLVERRIDPEYEILFEVGVDPETPEELDAAMAQVNWPAVEEVWHYRHQLRDAILETIDRAPLERPIRQDTPLWALMMGIEHDRIHFETSSMLLRQLSLDRVQRPEGWHYAPSTGKPPENQMRRVPGGTVELGKPANSPLYGWDSEYGNRTVEVQPFFASKYLISNGEFLTFLERGGYENRECWDEESWAWKTEYQVKHPKFWRPTENGYRYRATFDELDLPLDWPVEVNHYEAMAFCRWQGTRLMSEAEWNLAVGEEPTTDGDPVAVNAYNLNLKYGSPSPVGAIESACSRDGLYDLRGNLWELIGDRFYPLPGFKPHPLYEDQSAPFFDTKHCMMLGGSWATTGTMAAKSYRNWFRPYFYQHAGFRTARDA
ncbi:MAG: 5-histidylcysteine sulfoxide synthase [Cyanobacteriota bacterium]|nr:5-histidylcysteine sulfoxide synthase [Cyanobacteriota bacterium]